MKPRNYITIAALLLLVIVLLQNMEPVWVEFLFWQTLVPEFALIIVVLLVGFGFGWSSHMMWARRRRKRKEHDESAAAAAGGNEPETPVRDSGSATS